MSGALILSLIGIGLAVGSLTLAALLARENARLRAEIQRLHRQDLRTSLQKYLAFIAQGGTA